MWRMRVAAAGYRHLAIVTALLMALSPAIASAESPPGYRLLWHDEFDSLSIGDPGSGARWLPYFARFNVRYLAGNEDKGFKMADGEAIESGVTVRDVLKQQRSWPLHEIVDGALVLRAFPLSPALSPRFSGFRYIASMASGEQQHAQLYGYWEVRLRLDNLSRGQHFTAWLLPADGGWPPEIDMLEVIGNEPDTLYINGMGAKQAVPITRRTVPHLTHNWLTVGFLWTPEAMRWTLNGQTVREQPNFIDRQKLYFLMTWEIADRWTGPPDATTVWPAQVSIDYVRIYQAVDGTESGRGK